jgi:hypothetical protein
MLLLLQLLPLLLLLLLPLLLRLLAQLLVLGGELPEPARQVLEGGVGPSRLSVQLVVLASCGHYQIGFLPLWLLPVRVLLVVLVTKKEMFSHLNLCFDFRLEKASSLTKPGIENIYNIKNLFKYRYKNACRKNLDTRYLWQTVNKKIFIFAAEGTGQDEAGTLAAANRSTCNFVSQRSAK